MRLATDQAKMVLMSDKTMRDRPVSSCPIFSIGEAYDVAKRSAAAARDYLSNQRNVAEVKIALRIRAVEFEPL